MSIHDRIDSLESRVGRLADAPKAFPYDLSQMPESVLARLSQLKARANARGDDPTLDADLAALMPELEPYRVGAREGK